MKKDDELIFSENENENEMKSLDNVVGVVSLRGMVMFPSMLLHFDIDKKINILALEEAMKKSQPVFIVSQKNVDKNFDVLKDVYKVGVLAKVKHLVHHPGKVGRALIEGISRARIVSFIDNELFLKAKIENIIEISGSKDIKNKAVFRNARDMFIEYLRVCPRVPVDLALGAHSIKSSGQLADFICSNVSFEIDEKQKILEEKDEDLRLEKVTTMLAREFDILKIENSLALKLKNSIDKHQKDYFLREQMKIISEELGEDESPYSDTKKYFKKINELKLNKQNTEKLLEEARRFSKIPIISGESSIYRNYLDFCLLLPWNKKSISDFDITKTQKILDKEHYGLHEVKERIIEFLASCKLSKKNNAQILCLVGPPGIGKTTIVESLAKAMKRKFVRISLGGIHDESEIRGHRKTYIGAMPGRIISSIKKVGVKNPVILLDEVDKLSKDWHGDPSAALLEVLDPEQNSTFCDHYLDLDFDLGEVFFITTANDKSQIPLPLYDRMEVIELYSYTHEEKFNIAKKHLIPKQLLKNGLTSKRFSIENSAIDELIIGYTREAGVRDLERKISSLMRKAAKKIVIDDTIKKIIINVKSLESELGPYKYKIEKKLESTVGVVRGLAWTSVGGETMSIEVSLMKGKGKLSVTGSLGNVMKESAEIAVSYIRSNAEKFGINCDFYNKCDIHIHAPEGAVPKDGPSAGVTMTTALLSAISKIPVRQDVAMTGEITLKGNVLPIGGLKEKTMAAYKAGVKTVIIPADNERDLIKIDDKVKSAINFVTADSLDIVFKNALISSFKN